MTKKTIGLIGGGNMGEALIKGLAPKYDVHICESNPARVKYLKEKYHNIVVGDTKVVESSGVLILAVKPQDMAPLLEQVTAPEKKLFISIAAGLTTRYFEKHLGGKTKVVRAMPNLPALIREGTIGISGGRYAKPADLKLAETILGTIGRTVVVREAQMDALTAVSGSGPAYVFLLVEKWTAAAEKLGFNKEQAKLLVYNTLLGSAHLLKAGSLDAAQLRAKVTSKGGTTEAAMKVFFKNNVFEKLMKAALSAARKRSGKLAK
ncbi:MAG: pyrroline-5-carboxylate reductase [Candidatus Omnitrophica bacterium]|nr:pyrroline-5-carboxylate reductase [Candidatus Omnitrophota bacterium]